jgi:RNA polymerase sigma-70 factor (ECF subfamily)
MTDSATRGHSMKMPPTALPRASAAWSGVRDEHGYRPPCFREVYDGYFDFVWRTLRRMGVPLSQLDDAAQDVFLVVHRRLGDFEGRSSLKTWLFGIVLRIASDARRSAGRRRTEPLSEQEPASVSMDTPAEATERAEAARLVRDLLEQLEEGKRAVFVLAELEQMTAPEIAEALGVNLNTVYSRLRAARREFVCALERHRARTRT